MEVLATCTKCWLCHCFYRAMRMHKRGICCYAVSVCPSVTFVDHSKMNKHIFEIFSPSGSHTVLVFPHQTGCRYSDGNPPNGGVECKGYAKMTIFDQYLALSQKRLWAHTCSETICQHRILFPFIQHLASFPQGRPQGKPKCGKNSDFWTYALN